MSWFSLPRKIKSDLLANAAVTAKVGQRVHYQSIDQESVRPHIYFARQGRDDDDCLVGDGVRIERYVFEIVANQQLETLVDAVVDTVKAITGDVGDRNVQYVEVEDAGDEYLFRSIGEGDASFLHALQITFYLC